MGARAGAPDVLLRLCLFDAPLMHVSFCGCVPQRGWSGSAWSVVAGVDPWTNDLSGVQECASITNMGIYLVWSLPLEAWLSFGFDIDGFSYSTSTDLINWSSTAYLFSSYNASNPISQTYQCAWEFSLISYIFFCKDSSLDALA